MARDVDRDGQRRVGLLPERGLPAGLLEDEEPDVDDQAGLLGDRDELERCDQAALRVPPAHERLGRDRALRDEVDHRLVPDLELAAIEGPAQLGLGAQARGGPGAHRLVEQLVAAASALLGPVHRRVGVAQQGPGRVVRRGGERDSGTDREEVLAAVDHQRAVDLGREALSDLRGLVGRVDAGADDDELVAADARDGVRRAHRGGQPGGEGEQDGVAGGMAEGVVDQLEAVEVQRQDRHVDALPLPAGERVREPVERQRPVRQRGQWIVQRRMAHRFLVAVARDGDGDQRRDRREEPDLVVGEHPPFARVGVEDPERTVVVLDRDSDA